MGKNKQEKRQQKAGKPMSNNTPPDAMNRTDRATNAQNPMAGKLENRMYREGHDM